MALDVGANVPYGMMLPDPGWMMEKLLYQNYNTDQQTFSVSQVPLMGHYEMHGGFGSGSTVKNQDLSRHQGTCTSVMMLLEASFV